MAFRVAFGTTCARLLLKLNITFVFVCALLLMFPMSILTSPMAQHIPSSSSLDNNEIDGSGIINTPNHNSSSALRSIPFVGRGFGEDPLPIGRLCEYDSDCGNFSICRLVVSDQETTKKMCECEKKEMKEVNASCFIKPGRQCYFPNKNSHGYYFIPCFPGSVCKVSVNKSAPHNGYCMCKPLLDDNYRTVNEAFEMARCSSTSLLPLSYLVFAIIALSAHTITTILCNDR